MNRSRESQQRMVKVLSKPLDVVRIMDVCSSRKVVDKYFFNVSIRHVVPVGFEGDSGVIARAQSAMTIFITLTWEAKIRHRNLGELEMQTFLHRFVSLYFNVRSLFHAVEQRWNLAQVLDLRPDVWSVDLCTYCLYPDEPCTNFSGGQFTIQCVPSSRHSSELGILPVFSSTAHTMSFPTWPEDLFPGFTSYEQHAYRLVFLFLVHLRNNRPVRPEFIAVLYDGSIVSYLAIAFMNGFPIPSNIRWDEATVNALRELEIVVRQHSELLDIPASVRFLISTGDVYSRYPEPPKRKHSEIEELPEVDFTLI
jgi:hypothetical protein